MKKIISLLVCLALMFSLSISAFAAGSAQVNSNSSANVVKLGDTITVTVSLKDSAPFKSMALTPNYDKNVFEMVSGEWLLTGATLADFNGTSAAIAYTPVVEKSGAIFKYVLKVKDNATLKNTTIKTDAVIKNGATTVESVAGSVTVKVICKNHTFGEWNKVDNNNHKRICSACDEVETAIHNWDNGKITKAATCKEAGIKTYTCTACNATKTETIAKTNSHNWSGYKVTKEPTCTAAGTQTRTCSVCGKTESQSVPATGHSYGAWTTTKEPTCTEKGVETRKCSKCSATETKDIAALGHKFSNPTVTKQPTCTETGIESGKCTRCGTETTNTLKATGHNFGSWKNDKSATCTEGGTQKRICSKCGAEETRKTSPLGHDFENPAIVKEATISTTGLKEGKCKRCGETTSEVIPCSEKNEATGILFQTEVGVFAEGTQLTVEEIKTDNPTYESVKNVLSEVTGTFTVYDISAVLNGAKVQPNGEVTVTFNIPEGYGTDVAVFYISDAGTYEKLESLVSEDGKTVSAKLTHFSKYAVCKLGETDKIVDKENTETDNINTAEKETKSSTALWIILAAVIIAVIIVVTVIIIKKKRLFK